MNLSNYKIKVEAGMATIVNETHINPVGSMDDEDIKAYNDLERFAAENTFVTDDNVPDGIYDGSEFGDEVWSWRNSNSQWTVAENQPHTCPFTFDEFKNDMKPFEIKRYRPFIGTLKHPSTTCENSVGEERKSQAVRDSLIPDKPHFENKYGFLITDFDFKAPRLFVMSLAKKIGMKKDEVDTLTETIEMFLDGRRDTEVSALKERVKELEGKIKAVETLWVVSNCDNSPHDFVHGVGVSCTLLGYTAEQLNDLNK